MKKIIISALIMTISIFSGCSSSNPQQAQNLQSNATESYTANVIENDKSTLDNSTTDIPDGYKEFISYDLKCLVPKDYSTLPDDDSSPYNSMIDFNSNNYNIQPYGSFEEMISAGIEQMKKSGYTVEQLNISGADYADKVTVEKNNEHNEKQVVYDFYCGDRFYYVGFWYDDRNIDYLSPAEKNFIDSVHFN
ncbi:MAG: hypothetical protein IJ598_08180 [Ruminococcus sp.]|nr:hypothetical protein [Ruminococcus sp.]